MRGCDFLAYVSLAFTGALYLAPALTLWLASADLLLRRLSVKRDYFVGLYCYRDGLPDW